jgi:hypothetical protein
LRHAVVRKKLTTADTAAKMAEAAANRELEAALAQVTQLQGLLPICSYCKKIRDGEDYWHQVENYFATRTDVKFSHSFCPGCYERVLKQELEMLPEQSKPPAGNDGPADGDHN